MSKKILVTGGTGYIGSHTVVELLNAGHEVEILDNLFNSKIEVLDKIEQLTGTKPKFHQVDLLDYAGLKLNTPLSISDNPSILLEEPGIWSAIYRRDFLNKNKIRFRTTPGASYQDTGFHFKSFCAAKRIVYTKKAYLHYRTDNANSSVKSLEKVNYIVGEYAEIEKYIGNLDLSKEAIYTLQVAKFGAYHWNQQRLPKTLAVKFAKTIKAEFKTTRESDLLQKKYFPSHYWIALQLILHFSPQFYCSILSIRKRLKAK